MDSQHCSMKSREIIFISEEEIAEFEKDPEMQRMVES